MADQDLLAQNFDLGMQQDRARDQMQRGVCWKMTDYIPQDQAPLRKRGGWVFGSADLGGLSAASYMTGVGWAPFPGAGHLVSVSDTGKVYREGPVGAIDQFSGILVDATLGRVPTSRLVWHRDRVIICPGLNQAAMDPAKYYDAGSGSYVTAPVGGTPPRARWAMSYGDYLALGNGYDPASSYALKADRLWFSNVGTPDSWNTGANGGYMDFGREIVFGAWNRSIFLVWSYDLTWIVSGTSPPPGGDFVRQPLFNVGCFDARSVAYYREYFIWANPSGIYRTDGTTLTDITKEAGIKQLWRSLTAGFNVSTGWTCAAGMLYGQYYCTVLDPSGVSQGTIVIDQDSYVATMHTNIRAMMYADRVSAQGTASESGVDELFVAWRGGPRVLRLASFWTPTSANRYDADGTPVLPVIETPYFKQGRTEDKRIRFCYLGYDLRDGGDTPRLAVGFALSPELQAYTEGSYQFPPTTEFDRKRVDIRRRSEGFSLRIRQTAASADTRLAEIEAEGHPLEGSR